MALGGILLYAGSGTLRSVTDSAKDMLNTEPEDTQVTDDNGSTEQNQEPQNGDGSDPDTDSDSDSDEGGDFPIRPLS